MNFADRLHWLEMAVQRLLTIVSRQAAQIRQLQQRIRELGGS